MLTRDCINTFVQAGLHPELLYCGYPKYLKKKQIHTVSERDSSQLTVTLRGRLAISSVMLDKKEALNYEYFIF